MDKRVASNNTEIAAFVFTVAGLVAEGKAKTTAQLKKVYNALKPENPPVIQQQQPIHHQQINTANINTQPQASNLATQPQINNSFVRQQKQTSPNRGTNTGAYNNFPAINSSNETIHLNQNFLPAQPNHTNFQTNSFTNSNNTNLNQIYNA